MKAAAIGYAVRRRTPGRSFALTSGVMAAGIAANSDIWQARYGGNNLDFRAMVDAVTLYGLAADGAVPFTPGFGLLELYIARAFTAAGAIGGGTAADLTGNNGKLRTAHPVTGMTEIRIAGTALLATGTRTLDANPIASIPFGVPGIVNQQLVTLTPLFSARVDRKEPAVLATDEGLVLRVATIPGAGAWRFSVGIDFSEARRAP